MAVLRSCRRFPQRISIDPFTLIFVGQYLKKGSSIYVEGRIRTRKWKDREGQERYTTEIEATEMQMLGSRPEQSEPASASYGSMKPKTVATAQSTKPVAQVDIDDDIPF